MNASQPPGEGVLGRSPPRLPARMIPWLILVALCGLLSGCGSPPSQEATVEVGKPATLLPGQVFHFVDHFAGGEGPASLSRRADGPYRLSLGNVHQPALAAPAPYLIRQQIRLPAGALLRVGFGLAAANDDRPGGQVRFSVRVRGQGRTTELLARSLARPSGPDAATWTPVTLSLNAFSGQQVELELVTQGMEGSTGPPSDALSRSAMWVNPVIVAPSENDRPNIVVVLVDALRADHLGCYGYPRPTSPFIDRFSQEAVLFEQAHSQDTYTLVSVHSLLTSSYRFAAGLQAAQSSKPDPGKQSEELLLGGLTGDTSLAHQLGAAGYTTLACVDGGFLNPTLGMDSGFDWYWCNNTVPVLSTQLPVLRRRLGDHPEQPFFLLLHTYQVHNYFEGATPPLKELDRGHGGKPTDPARLADAILSGKVGDLTRDDLQHVEDLYDSDIRRADRDLGGFFRWLLKQPWGRNTIIVLTADHGEMMGEQGRLHHGCPPYWPAVHVPLVIRFPDGRGRGRRISQPVALVDFMPTLLDFAGATAPKACVGRTLRPLIEGRSSQGSAPVFSESKDWLMVREGKWWYLTRAGEATQALYDMETDPGQTTDLSARQPQVISHIRHVLADAAMKSPHDVLTLVTGPREQEVVLTLECDAGFSYLYCPTLRQPWGRPKPVKSHPEGKTAGARRAQTAAVAIPPGDDWHVVLAESREPGAAIRVSALAGGRPVEPARFRLGRQQIPAAELPVVAARTTGWLVAQEPPTPRESSWGVWLWLSPSVMARRAPSLASGAGLSPKLGEQLRALGYLR